MSREVRVPVDVIASLRADRSLRHTIPTFMLLAENRDWTSEGKTKTGRQRIAGFVVANLAWIAETNQISVETAGTHIARLVEAEHLTLWSEANSQHSRSREFLITALAEAEVLVVAEQRALRRAEKARSAEADRERRRVEGALPPEIGPDGRFRRSHRLTTSTPTVTTTSVGTVTTTSVGHRLNQCEVYLCEEKDVCEHSGAQSAIEPTPPPSSFAVTQSLSEPTLTAPEEEDDPSRLSEMFNVRAQEGSDYRKRLFSHLADVTELDSKNCSTLSGLLAFAWVADLTEQFDSQQIAALVDTPATASKEEWIMAIFAELGLDVIGHEGHEARTEYLQMASVNRWSLDHARRWRQTSTLIDLDHADWLSLTTHQRKETGT